jgi:putative transposase
VTTPSDEAVSVTLSRRPRSRTELALEEIALRHQIAVLKRSGTRRPCFRRWDPLFWIVLSWWWPRWRQALMMVQPETVVRWRRDVWSRFWRYGSRGRWRGGHPRVSSEIRELIARMARENFTWGAPRIHGELLMLGFDVSQATVSRYLSTVYRHFERHFDHRRSSITVRLVSSPGIRLSVPTTVRLRNLTDEFPCSGAP